MAQDYLHIVSHTKPSVASEIILCRAAAAPVRLSKARESALCTRHHPRVHHEIPSQMRAATNTVVAQRYKAQITTQPMANISKGRQLKARQRSNGTLVNQLKPS